MNRIRAAPDGFRAAPSLSRKERLMRYLTVLMALAVLAATVGLVSLDRRGMLIASHTVTAPQFSPSLAADPVPQ